MTNTLHFYISHTDRSLIIYFVAVGRAIIAGLLATKQHEIVILTRGVMNLIYRILPSLARRPLTPR